MIFGSSDAVLDGGSLRSMDSSFSSKEFLSIFMSASFACASASRSCGLGFDIMFCTWSSVRSDAKVGPAIKVGWLRIFRVDNLWITRVGVGSGNRPGRALSRLCGIGSISARSPKSVPISDIWRTATSHTHMFLFMTAHLLRYYVGRPVETRLSQSYILY